MTKRMLVQLGSGLDTQPGGKLHKTISEVCTPDTLLFCKANSTTFELSGPLSITHILSSLEVRSLWIDRETRQGPHPLLYLYKMSCFHPSGSWIFLSFLYWFCLNTTMHQCVYPKGANSMSFDPVHTSFVLGNVYCIFNFKISFLWNLTLPIWVLEHEN